MLKFSCILHFVTNFFPPFTAATKKRPRKVIFISVSVVPLTAEKKILNNDYLIREGQKLYRKWRVINVKKKKVIKIEPHECIMKIINDAYLGEYFWIIN